MIGVGSQDDFGQAVDFVVDTGLDSTAMLWEDTGALWRIHEIHNNSSLQLFSHDLDRASQVFFFTDQGRRTILDAAPMAPWAP